MNNLNRRETTLLVVDDAPVVLDGTVRVLAQAGYAVLGAADGEAGLKVLREQRPDIVLLDRDLSGIDGLEICRQIKRESSTSDTFVVLISGTYVETDDQAEGLELGADGYITRPVTNREFLARMESFVRIMQLNRSLRRNADELRARSEAATRASDAALNLMEDAVETRDRLQKLNEQLQQEITERKAAEGLLREQAEIIANAHEGVMIVNLANEIILWSRGAEKIFGCPAADALGRAPDDILGIADRETVAKLRTAVERDGFWHGELRSQTRDNRQIVLDCRTTLVRDAAGKPRARLNFFGDITEKKVLEEQFLQAQRLESVGMLAAGIAHDLNNVLAPIVFAAPMLRDSLSNARDLKILDTLERSAGRGAALVQQILGFTRTTHGEFRPTQVKHLARDVIAVIEETFPKAIQLEHHVPSDLWPVHGNATQVHQVLLNLCVNARDAMPGGGVLTLVASNRRLDAAAATAIPGARPGVWLVIEVSDTGTGIPPEIVSRIWDPFFTTKEAGKGTGLGLPTVRGIVAHHGGFIELQTEVGRGTTFRVFLPALATEEAAPVNASPPKLPVGHGEQVLVVDDDPAIREIIAAILGKQGYRVVACADGVAALAEFTTRPSEFSAVVTDVDMPRLGGVALARTLLHLRPEIRLLAISGLSHNESGTSDVPAVRELVHGFLLKPFTTEDLLSTLDRLLHPVATPEMPCPPS